MSGPSATARSAVTQPSVVSLHYEGETGPDVPAHQTTGRDPVTNDRLASRRQRVFDQLDPVGRAEDDRVVVEIVGGMMQPGTVAVAAENKRPRPLFQHKGEILG